MWWNPRAYTLLACLFLLGRYSYRSTLRGLNEEFDTFSAFVLFWLPLFGVIVIAGSYVGPPLWRWATGRREL